MVDQNSMSALDILVIEESNNTILSKKNYKKKCCNKIAKGKQCKRCPLHCLNSIIITCSILTSTFAYSQISGISTAKLAANSPETIGKKTFEIEPNFSYTWGDKEFNSSSSLKTNDSNFNDVEIGLRVAYGISDKIDVGAYFDEELTILNLGGRYHFLNHEKFNLGTIIGLNIPLKDGFNFSSQTLHDEDNSISYAVGLASSYAFSERFSMNSDIQFQDHFSNLDTQHGEDYFFNTDFGYELSKKWVVMSGVNYSFSHHRDSENNAENLILNSGVAFSPENTFYNFTLNFPFSVYGKNSEQINGVQFAWTFAF